MIYMNLRKINDKKRIKRYAFELLFETESLEDACEIVVIVEVDNVVAFSTLFLANNVLSSTLNVKRLRPGSISWFVELSKVNRAFSDSIE